MSPLPPLGGGHDQSHLIPFFPTYEPSSSFTYPISFHPSPEVACDHDHHLKQETGGSNDPLVLLVSLPRTDGDHDNERKNNTEKLMHDDASKSEPVKWMSSKMRLMKKMMNSDRVIVRKPRKNLQVSQDQQQQQQSTGNNSSSSNTNLSGPIRTCSDCNTTKTPLWRSGPQGPKSLCNACGIRQRKARKAMAEAAAVSSGLIPVSTPTKMGKEKGSDHGVHAIVPFKKRCKFTTVQARKTISFNDFGTVNPSKNSDFHHGVFPLDEKEAAILLMALSCGIICR